MSHRGVVKLINRVDEAGLVTETERHASLKSVVYLGRFLYTWDFSKFVIRETSLQISSPLNTLEYFGISGIAKNLPRFSSEKQSFKSNIKGNRPTS